MLGSGVLTLSAVNTYAGATLINSGGTIALTDAGLLANSSLVTNNGTFDILLKTSNTNLAGNYVQSGTDTLKMGVTTSDNVKLLIAGSATLGGTLYVNAALGHYAAGHYTLINAQSGRTGTFSNFTNGFRRIGIQVSFGI